MKYVLYLVKKKVSFFLKAFNISEEQFCYLLHSRQVEGHEKRGNFSLQQQQTYVHACTHSPITVHITGLTAPTAVSMCYLAFLQVIIELFLLKKLLHFCLHQHSPHIDDLIHCQGQALHRVAELLLIITQHID